MANIILPPKAAGVLKAYEMAGQLDLMADKQWPASELIVDLQNGTGQNFEFVDTSGAIGTTHGMVVLAKAGVAVMTLAAPVIGKGGKQLVIMSATANAHTVTCPAGKLMGLATATFSGAIGDNLVLRSYNGVWYVQSKVGVVLS